MSKFASHVLLLDAKQKRLNAGPKARLDTAHFLSGMGFRIAPVPISRSRYWQRILAWWVTAFDTIVMREGDIVWCQFPVDRTTQAVLEKARSKGFRTVAFVHDIEGLKTEHPQWDSVARESRLLLPFTAVVGLNAAIGSILKSHGVKVLSELNLWDYVCDEAPASDCTSFHQKKRVVFAGSLAPDKAQFIYRLRFIAGVNFELHGEGLDRSLLKGENVHYLGSFAPQNPPFQADGALGLVWDGSEIDRCGGDFGAYLAFNTPHKASMYLARGMPVIVWRGAAVAPLIASYRAGFLISSLEELPSLLDGLSESDYAEVASNARSLGEKVRAGHFIHSAVKQLQTALVRDFSDTSKD
jgi:hypothetical protein